MKLSMTKDLARNLLIAAKGRVPRRKLEHAPTPMIAPSPLITNFEKWAGKKRKLYFEDEERMFQKGIPDFQLNKNVFAQILASPMRCDRNTRLKLPKDMMIQLKLKKIETQTDNEKIEAELVSLGSHSKGGKSSYISNSKRLSEKNLQAAQKWVPLPALLSDMRNFSISDVRINNVEFLKNHEKELRKILDAKLPQLEREIIKLKKWDILVCCHPDCTPVSPFEIYQVGCELSGDSPVTIVKFNMGRATRMTWAGDCISKYQNHPLGIVLRLPYDKDLIYAFFNLVSSSHS